MSASGPVAICRRALTLVGADTIVDLDDTSKTEARVCAIHYESVRDSLLSDEDWTFARRRVGPLSPLVATPIGFKNAFQKPTNSLVIRWVGSDPSVEWQIEHEVEDDQILSDYDNIYVRYTIRVTDTTKFVQPFTEALVMRLARDIAIPLAESKGLRDQLEAAYQRTLDDAAAVDALQGINKRMEAKRHVARRGRGRRGAFSREYYP